METVQKSIFLHGNTLLSICMMKIRLIEYLHLRFFVWTKIELAKMEKDVFLSSFSEKEMLQDGYPAYTTSCAWLGYSDDKIVRVSMIVLLCNL